MGRDWLIDQIARAMARAENASEDHFEAYRHVAEAVAAVVEPLLAEKDKAEAKANEERQRGYDNCEVCGRIDTIKELPKGLQALGSDVALGISR